MVTSTEYCALIIYLGLFCHVVAITFCLYLSLSISNNIFYTSNTESGRVLELGDSDLHPFFHLPLDRNETVLFIDSYSVSISGDDLRHEYTNGKYFPVRGIDCNISISVNMYSSTKAERSTF